MKKLITIDEAIKLINERHQFDSSKNGKNVYSKKTIYNRISLGLLTRYGPRHIVQLDEEEVLAAFCG